MRCLPIRPDQLLRLWVAVAGVFVAGCGGSSGDAPPAPDPPPQEEPLEPGPEVLNDTGVARVACYAMAGDDLVDCADASARDLSPVQDGMTGRDATAPDDSDGRLGFSFEPVPRRSGGLHDLTECVRDNVTGKVWEGKGDATSPRPGSRAFLNDPVDPAGNDVTRHVAAVNAERLCGFADWRLPTVLELQGLVDYGRPGPGFRLDPVWFPNLSAAVKHAWTSDALGTGDASAVWTVDLTTGYPVPASRRPGFDVGARLVRGGRPAPAGPRFVFTVGSNEVLDALTGLTWRRCTFGSVIDVTNCGSGSFFMTHEQALRFTRNSTDWRVPNIKELSTLVDRSRTPPLRFSSAFPNLTTNGTFYWTSTPAPDGPGQVLVTGFRDGELAAHPRAAGAFLLLVK